MRPLDEGLSGLRRVRRDRDGVAHMSRGLVSLPAHNSYGEIFEWCDFDQRTCIVGQYIFSFEVLLAVGSIVLLAEEVERIGIAPSFRKRDRKRSFRVSWRCNFFEPSVMG